MFKKASWFAMVMLAMVTLGACAPAPTGSASDAPREYSTSESIRLPHGTSYFAITYPAAYLTGTGDALKGIRAGQEFSTFTGERIPLGSLNHLFKMTDETDDKIQFRLVKVTGEREVRDRTGGIMYYQDHVKLTFEATTTGIAYSGNYGLKLTFDNKYDRNVTLTVLEALN